jgi:hypothetical protein
MQAEELTDATADMRMQEIFYTVCPHISAAKAFPVQRVYLRICKRVTDTLNIANHKLLFAALESEVRKSLHTKKNVTTDRTRRIPLLRLVMVRKLAPQRQLYLRYLIVTENFAIVVVVLFKYTCSPICVSHYRQNSDCCMQQTEFARARET